MIAMQTIPSSKCWCVIVGDKLDKVFVSSSQTYTPASNTEIDQTQNEYWAKYQQHKWWFMVHLSRIIWLNIFSSLMTPQKRFTIQ